MDERGVGDPAAVGLLVVGTHRYRSLLKPLLDSAREFFLNGHRLHFFVFTDEPDAVAGDDVTALKIDHLPWPLITLMRYHWFSRFEETFAEMDYLFYCDADMRFVAPCGDEVLPDTDSGLVAVDHPGFCVRPRPRRLPPGVHRLLPRSWRMVERRMRGTYETRRESSACVRRSEGTIYYFGAFNGGTRDAFLSMSRSIRDAVNEDLSNQVIAVWQDESHLNRYLIDHPPKVLPPLYGHPEEWFVPGSPILRILPKDNKAIRRE